MPLVHLLTGGPDLRLSAVVCGSRTAQCATWEVRLVTCPRCLGPSRRRPTAGGMSEKAWLQQVVTLARQRGYLVYHTHNSQKSAPGWPDVALAKAASPLYLVELKTTHGQPSGHQRLWIDTLRQTTGLVVEMWRPEDWDTVREVLR